MNKKCYIAGKIGGLPEAEYTAYFDLAKQQVKYLGLDPVSPIDLPHDHEKRWSDFMREDLAELLKCSHLYALRNWRTSPGATIEVNLALAIGINIIHQP